MNDNLICREILGKHLELREISKKPGFLGVQVRFYVVTWGNKNAHDEIFVKGSEARSLQLFKENKLKHFKNHDRYNSPGVVVGLEADDYGLIITSDLIDNTTGRDTLAEYQTGQITEHSAGFWYVENGVKYDQQSDTLFITDFELREGSSLNGWGSDSKTKLISLNSDEFRRDKAEIIKRYSVKEEKGIDYKYLINNY